MVSFIELRAVSPRTGGLKYRASVRRKTEPDPEVLRASPICGREFEDGG